MQEIFKRVFTDYNFLSAFFQTVILIFIGYIFRKKNIITQEAKSAVSAIVWKLAVPCFAFNAFMQDFDKTGFVACIALFFLALFIYTVLISTGKLLFFKKKISVIAAMFLAVGQTTLFSMPLLLSVYAGKDGEQQVMLYISVISIAFRIMVYLVGYILISGEKIHKDNLGVSLRKIFLTPIMVGMFLGIIIYIFQDKAMFLRVDKSVPVLYKTVRTIAQLVNPLSMIIIGMSVGEGNFRDAFSDVQGWIIALLRNLLAPVLVTAIAIIVHKLGLIQFNEYSLTTLVIAFSAPISVTLCIFCVQYHREELLASRACMISTILSIITIPFAFVLCFWATGILN